MSGTHMPDEHDEEATARAEADVMGLGILDAVDMGGTWTVVGDREAVAAPPDPDVTALTPKPAAVALSREPDAPARGPEPAVAEPAPEADDGRRRRRLLLWAGIAGCAALVLMIAAVISQAVPGPRPLTASPPAAAGGPGATDRPGTGRAAPARTRGTMSPGGVVPAARLQPSGPTSAPLPSASGGTPPTPTPPRQPTPTPTMTITSVPISPTALPAPSPTAVPTATS